MYITGQQCSIETIENIITKLIFNENLKDINLEIRCKHFHDVSTNINYSVPYHNNIFILKHVFASG